MILINPAARVPEAPAGFGTRVLSGRVPPGGEEDSHTAKRGKEARGFWVRVKQARSRTDHGSNPREPLVRT